MTSGSAPHPGSRITGKARQADSQFAASGLHGRARSRRTVGAYHRARPMQVGDTVERLAF